MPRRSDQPKPPPKPKRRTLPKPGRLSHDNVLVALSRLNELDRQIILWLYQFRYATTFQVHAQCFARSGVPEKKTLQTCRRRLWELGDRGLLTALTYNQRERAWYLDRMGLLAAEEILRVPEHRRMDLEEWRGSPLKLKHYLAILDLAMRLGEVNKQHTWQSRTRLVWKIDRGERYTVHYIYPDATVNLRWGNHDEHGVWDWRGWDPVYLEVDMDTEDLAEIEHKLARYEAAFSMYPDAWNVQAAQVEAEVAPFQKYLLFASPSSSRARAIQALIDRRALPGLSVTLHEASDTLSNIWQRYYSHRQAVDRRLAEEKQAKELREREEAQRQRQAELIAKRRADWDKYDHSAAAYRIKEDEYATTHKSLWRSEISLRDEYRRNCPPPVAPEFPRPD